MVTGQVVMQKSKQGKYSQNHFTIPKYVVTELNLKKGDIFSVSYEKEPTQIIFIKESQ